MVIWIYYYFKLLDFQDHLITILLRHGKLGFAVHWVLFDGIPMTNKFASVISIFRTQWTLTFNGKRLEYSGFAKLQPKCDPPWKVWISVPPIQIEAITVSGQWLTSREVRLLVAILYGQYWMIRQFDSDQLRRSACILIGAQSRMLIPGVDCRQWGSKFGPIETGGWW